MDIKKTIYLPIEIKNRELFGHLFLAFIAIQRGYRVILGNKSNMYKSIDTKDYKAGVLIYKGGGRSPELLSGLKEKLERICILDQELGVAVRDLRVFFEGRYDPSVIKYIDRFYLLGKRFADASINYAQIAPEKLCVTGWPRTDVWQQTGIWESHVNKLKETYGNFILYSSDFGTLTRQDVEQRAKRATKWTHVKDKRRYLEHKKQNEMRLNEFTTMVEHIKALALRDDIPLIIVRPHYSENFKAWHEALQDVQGVKVINEGSISPWLIASEALLHSGCTTAFEAQLLGKKSAYFTDTVYSVGQAYTLEVSKPLTNLGEFLEWMKGYSNNQVAEIDTNQVYMEGDFAAIKIIDDLDTFDLKPEKTPPKPTVSRFVRLGRHMPEFLKNTYRFLMFVYKNPGLLPLADYRQKMPGGISVVECQSFLNSINEQQLEISVSLLEKDLISIEMKKN